MPKWHWACNCLKKIALFVSRAKMAFGILATLIPSRFRQKNLLLPNTVKLHDFLLMPRR